MFISIMFYIKKVPFETINYFNLPKTVGNHLKIDNYRTPEWNKLKL